MKKQIMAFVLSGAMLLGGCVSVFAADAAAESEVSQAAEGDQESLSALLGSIGSKGLDGLMSSFGGEEGLGGLLNSVGGEEGLGGLLNSVGGKEGLGGLLSSVVSGDSLDDLLNSTGITDLIGAVSDENGCVDVSALMQMFGLDGLPEKTEELKEMLSGFFQEGEIGSDLLDTLAAEGGNLEALIESMKDEAGAYDVGRIIACLTDLKSKGNGLVINGIEITEEEFRKAFPKMIEFFIAIGQMEAESEAA